MPIPLLDLTRVDADFERDLEEAVLGVLRSGRYILGPEVDALEAELVEYIGAKHVIGLSSGTDALLAALMALDIGPGDAVAVPVYTFFATAGTVTRLGARPVFVDVEPVYKCMDPAKLEEALAKNPDIKAVMPVHLYGAGADMDAIMSLAAAKGLPVVEDAAQAIGTKIKGRSAGTMGIAGCFSTFPSKNLGGIGDGGFLSCMDDAFATKIRQMRNHGQTGSYEHAFVGGNFRIDALQAAGLRVKLRRIEKMTEARRANAARYRELFAAKGLAEVEVPADQDRHCYHQYLIHLPREKRDAVRSALQEQQIGCAVYYPIPLHLQPCYAELGHATGEFPVAEDAALRNLALPIYPELRPDEQDQVVDAIAAAL
ncbi:MAG: DegT/DnrJ/EryC1/StrS family aminotransferase [Planctomycetota bacterium]|jgi:dTDP-4-amino-4,6-dideoxygalactose transaminase